jgi:hypothetical protein
MVNQSEPRKRNGQSKLKKRTLKLISSTLQNTGWLTLMYFLWISYNPIGVALSIICLFSSDYISLLGD